jgi:hypothetical protein
MDNLENEFIHIHQEVIRREVETSQALRQSGMVNPHLSDRGLTLLGDALIRIGTRLKDRTYTRLNAEEASAPTFLIML